MPSAAGVSLYLLIASTCAPSGRQENSDSLEIRAFRADSVAPLGGIARYWERFRVDSADLARHLATSRVVTEWEWTHHYSHVAGGDRTGWARLANGCEVRWMVRPGGLMTLRYRDGEVVHLVWSR
jgi:hypothetical protein